MEGDGYEGNKSPHSSYERFEGVTVGRMALVRIIYIELVREYQEIISFLYFSYLPISYAKI